MPERAEIEAVARIIEKWCRRDMPTAYDCATEILDRVRDARDDDEAARGTQVSHWECECGQRVQWKLGAWFCPTHRDSAVVHPVTAPSRDGTVAVEDLVAALRSYSDDIERVRAIGGEVGRISHRLANWIEAEFGAARAGESNER